MGNMIIVFYLEHESESSREYTEQSRICLADTPSSLSGTYGSSLCPIEAPKNIRTAAYIIKAPSFAFTLSSCLCLAGAINEFPIIGLEK